MSQEQDQVRELAVCLAIADAASNNGYYRLGDIDAEMEDDFDFDVPFSQQEYVGADGKAYSLKVIDYDGKDDWQNGYTEENEFSSGALEDGFSFCAALREQGVDIDSVGQLSCETVWSRDTPDTAKRNYALGTMIADYFGLGPGSVEKVVWHGPENISGEERLMVPPADIGIKLVGTPDRSYDISDDIDSTYSYGMPDADNFKELLKFKEYDNDEDIMISLKDGSDILGNYGFAAFANLMLGTSYTNAIDCFEEYAPEEYDEWFNIAWNLLMDYLDAEGRYEIHSPGRSRSSYYIYYADDGITFERETSSGNIETFTAPYETTRKDWMCTHYESGKARKAFSAWCIDQGKQDSEYIKAQINCSKRTAKNLGAQLADGSAKEEWYNLVGWRLPEYYYAKVSRGKLALYGVPSIFTAEYYPIKVEVPKNILTCDIEGEDDEPLTTQSIVPFSLVNQDIGLNAEYKLVIRFKDGTFSGIPQALVHTKDKQHGMYNLLYEVPLADYLPE